MNYFRRLLNPDVPAEYWNTFLHLAFDIGWYGILAGSAINFVNVYAARLGATAFQIGLLGAMAALVNLLVAIPAGQWIEKRAVGRAVFWTSVFYRIGFLLWVPLPWLFNAQGQIWALIVLALLMGIPLTALGVGFNAFFATIVPSEWRGYVAGIRNVTQAITFMLTSLVCGYLLDHVAFPLNYQIVFLIGAFGAGMSSLHLYFINRGLEKKSLDTSHLQPAPASGIPESTSGHRQAPGWLASLRVDVWLGPFRNILLVLLAFHLAQFLAIPLFPVYFVNELHLTDQEIGLGNAVFYLAMLLGSLQLSSLSRRFGHKLVTGYGIIGMALYPILLAISSLVWQYYAISLIGGLVWAMVGGALANYLLDKVPAYDRPSHLAWYTVILNAAVLIGSLGGPAMTNMMGLSTALIVAGVMRLVAGILLLKWG